MDSIDLNRIGTAATPAALAAAPVAAPRTRTAVANRPLITGAGRYGVRGQASAWRTASATGDQCAFSGIPMHVTKFDNDVDPAFSTQLGPPSCSPPA